MPDNETHTLQMWDFYPGLLVRMRSDNRLLRVTSPKQKWIHGEFEDGTGWRFQPQHAKPAEEGAVFQSHLGDDLAVDLADTVRFKVGSPYRQREGDAIFVVLAKTREGVRLARLNASKDRYYRNIPRNQLERAEV